MVAIPSHGKIHNCLGPRGQNVELILEVLVGHENLCIRHDLKVAKLLEFVDLISDLVQTNQ